MSFQDNLRDATLDHFFLASAQTPRTVNRIGMFTVKPASDGAGGTEVSGGGYARVAISFDFILGSPNQLESQAAVAFGPYTTGSGTVVALGLWNDAATPELVAVAEIPPRTITAGGILEIAANDVIVEIE